MASKAINSGMAAMAMAAGVKANGGNNGNMAAASLGIIIGGGDCRKHNLAWRGQRIGGYEKHLNGWRLRNNAEMAKASANGG